MLNILGWLQKNLTRKKGFLKSLLKKDTIHSNYESKSRKNRDGNHFPERESNRHFVPLGHDWLEITDL